jgi:hypothetical protein
MTVSRILSKTIAVFAFVLGIIGSVGFHGISIEGDYYSDG